MNGLWLIFIAFCMLIFLIKAFEDELEELLKKIATFFGTYHRFLSFGLIAIFETMQPRTDAWYKKKVEEFEALK